MRKPDHRVMLALIENQISETFSLESRSEEISVSIKDDGKNPTIGEYEFESQSQFGSSTESEGYIVFDKESGLVAVTTRWDRPRPQRIFKALEDAQNVSYRMPNLKPEDQYNICREYGSRPVNGYEVSFKQNSTSFDVTDTMGLTLDPKNKAEERAKFGSERASESLVNEIAQDAMEEEMYIWSCRLSIGGYNITYSDPLVFTGVSDEFLDEFGFEKLFRIGRNCIH